MVHYLITLFIQIKYWIHTPLCSYVSSIFKQHSVVKWCEFGDSIKPITLHTLHHQSTGKVVVETSALFRYSRGTISYIKTSPAFVDPTLCLFLTINDGSTPQLLFHSHHSRPPPSIHTFNLTIHLPEIPNPCQDPRDLHARIELHHDWRKDRLMGQIRRRQAQ